MAMSIRRRGMVRFARRNAERRLGVLGCIRSLFRFAMKSMPLQEWIVFLFLEPIRRARTFLVSRGHVTRRRLAERLGLGAFEDNNFLRHFLLLFGLGRRNGFFFFGLATFLLGQSKERRNRLPDA